MLQIFSKQKNKYCCGWFFAYHQQPKTHDCIRVVRLNLENPRYIETEYAEGDTGRRRGVRDSNIPYRFFLWEAKPPINLKFDILSGGRILNYCPWCGANLFTFYGKERNIDDYVNEIEGETF
jgi:hypothetical protein